MCPEVAIHCVKDLREEDWRMMENWTQKSLMEYRAGGRARRKHLGRKNECKHQASRGGVQDSGKTGTAVLSKDMDGKEGTVKGDKESGISKRVQKFDTMRRQEDYVEMMVLGVEVQGMSRWMEKGLPGSVRSRTEAIVMVHRPHIKVGQSWSGEDLLFMVYLLSAFSASVSDAPHYCAKSSASFLSQFIAFLVAYSRLSIDFKTGKGVILYSAVSSPLDLSNTKCFHFILWQICSF